MNTTEIILLAVGVPVIGVGTYLLMKNKDRLNYTAKMAYKLPEAYKTSKDIYNDDLYNYTRNLSKESGDENDDKNIQEQTFKQITGGKSKTRKNKKAKKAKKSKKSRRN